MLDQQLCERRRFERYRGDGAVVVQVEADGQCTTGKLLNLSRIGAYLRAQAILFERGYVSFHLPGGGTLYVGCRLVDAGRAGDETMGIAFARELTEAELRLLIAGVYEESE